MDFNNFKKYIWSHFLQIEKDLIEIEPFVAFDKENLSTFSEKFFTLLQVIGSEIDVVAKTFCNMLSPETKVNKINEYAKVILAKYPNFENEKIWINKIEEIVHPFEKWNIESPSWWKNYNNAKHQRTNLDKNQKPYFNNCNLKNVFEALAGLYQLNMYLLREILIQIPDKKFNYYLPKQKLFNFERLDDKTSLFDNYDFDGVQIFHNFIC